MKIDVVADLHGHYPKLEGGDLLIIAGDLTATDTHAEYLHFFKWLHNQKYKKYIFIAGNHDNLLQKEEVFTNELANTTYLCDSGTEFDGLKIWGSPWSPWFPGINPLCKAFVLPDEALFDKWVIIPKGIDILITHTPAFGTLDYRELSDGTRYHMGSKSLEGWIKYVERPLVHAFGHIHEAHGMVEEYPTYNDKMMKSINASYVNEKYQPVNNPITVIL